LLLFDRPYISLPAIITFRHWVPYTSAFVGLISITPNNDGGRDLVLSTSTDDRHLLTTLDVSCMQHDGRLVARQRRVQVHWRYLIYLNTIGNSMLIEPPGQCGYWKWLKRQRSRRRRRFISIRQVTAPSKCRRRTAIGGGMYLVLIASKN